MSQAIIRLPFILILWLPLSTLAQVPDTYRVPIDTAVHQVDTLDSLAGDTLAEKKNPRGIYDLTAPSDIETTIEYKAADSMRFDVKRQVMTLDREAQIEYGNLQMKAYSIDISWQTNEVHAQGKVNDSTGKMTGTPLFKQGNDSYVAKEIRYNYKTEKGLIRDIVTQQGEGYIHGERVKKQNETDFYLNSARYTTCNLAEPHFEINARKIKMIKDKKIITGPFNLQIEHVPTPIGFAFGMFPTTNRERSSGVIIPTYGEALDRGFFLRDGGYYFGNSEYFDARIMGEIYSRGGFGLNNVINYKKRYHFGGNLNLRYVRRPVPGSDIEDRNFIRDVWLSWSHTPVARGNSRFSANVNVGSASFNRNNAFQANNFLSGTFNSSVNYSRIFPNSPFNLTLSATQDQNTITRIMNISLPNMSFNMNQIQPFRKKASAGTAWYEKIRVGYQSIAANSFSTAPRPATSFFNGIPVINSRPGDSDVLSLVPDSVRFLLERARFGMQHTIPVNASFRALKHFSINPSLTYRERWAPYKLGFTDYTTLQRGIRVDTISGFARNYDFDFNTGLTTQIYGIVKFKRGSIQAIRHKIIPTLAYVYRPDFSKAPFRFYEDRVVDSTGRRQNLNTFLNTLYGGPAPGTQQALRFDVQNNLEMKLRPRESDTASQSRKVFLLDNFGASGQYNFAADSGKLSAIGLNARTNILGKFNIAFNGVLSPYAVFADSLFRNAQGKADAIQYRSQSVYAWQAGQGLGQVTNFNIAVSTSLNPQLFGKKPPPKEKPTGSSQDEFNEVVQNPNRYVDFTVPWNLNLSYNLIYSKDGFREKQLTQIFNFTGDVSLTEKWKVGFTSGYDFLNKGISFTSIDITRDLHCWQMRFNWIPLGPRQSFQFDINVKSALLQDLKLSKRNNWYDR